MIGVLTRVSREELEKTQYIDYYCNGLGRNHSFFLDSNLR